MLFEKKNLCKITFVVSREIFEWCNHLIFSSFVKLVWYKFLSSMIFHTFVKRNAPYTSAQVHKPNNPNRVDFWELNNKTINENEKTTLLLLHVLANSCSLSIWVSTSIKLIAPLEGFPSYYKSDFPKVLYFE